MGTKYSSNYSREPARYILSLHALSLKKIGNCISWYLGEKRMARVKNKNYFQRKAFSLSETQASTSWLSCELEE